jgi:hypothetical protein
MAVQNANNVAITGGTINAVAITTGSINNTPIGATTANTGKFTDLTTTGTLTANGQAATGTHTVIAKWLPITCDGVTYYLPLYN